VEKPLGLNAAEVRQLADEARRNRVFLMEALWTVFPPKFDVLRQVLDDGLLGEVRSEIADHGEHFGPGHRIMRADLAGGPLLDLGTYPVTLATTVLGPAERVLASGQPAPGGVNGQASILLAHAGGNQSVLHTTLFSKTPTSATIAGTDATVTIPGPFYQPGGFRWPSTTVPRWTITRRRSATPTSTTRRPTSPAVCGTASSSHPCARSAPP
jgi:predicted dehydrogenase